MKNERVTSVGTVLAAALAVALWAIAASQGYALEMIWLLAVAVGVAWPRRTWARDCLRRLTTTPRQGR